jgi:ethanolamine ammonia-lyase large subunit
MSGLWQMLDDVRCRFDIPMQSCVLTHVTTQLKAMQAGLPVDLVFQSIAGTEAALQTQGLQVSLRYAF